MTPSTKAQSFTPKPDVPRPGIYAGRRTPDDFWPPRIVWGREQGWLNVRDPWGEWHSIPSREAPWGWGRIATRTKRGEL